MVKQKQHWSSRRWKGEGLKHLESTCAGARRHGSRAVAPSSTRTWSAFKFMRGKKINRRSKRLQEKRGVITAHFISSGCCSLLAHFMTLQQIIKDNQTYVPRHIDAGATFQKRKCSALCPDGDEFSVSSPPEFVLM